jgi:hypothetical protein
VYAVGGRRLLRSMGRDELELYFCSLAKKLGRVARGNRTPGLPQIPA